MLTHPGIIGAAGTSSYVSYYVDQTSGNDSNNGLTISTPFKTLSKINGLTFNPTDRILLKRGETWREQLIIPSSGTVGNNIVFGAYGSGDNPKIYGSTNVQSLTWAEYSTNIWRTSFATDPGTVWFDETGTITIGKEETLLASVNAKYDWYYGSSYLYVYSTTDPSSVYTAIEATIRNNCIQVGNGAVTRSYITVDGIELGYPSIYGLAQIIDGDAPGIVVKNSSFTKSGLFLKGASTIIQDNLFTGPQPTAAAGGGILISTQTAIGVQILRNTVSNYRSRGIWFWDGADSPTTNDNIVYDIAFTAGSSGEGYGINFDGYGRVITGTVTALRNTVYNCASNGIEMENCSVKSIINRNLIHDCARSGIIYFNYAAGTNYGDQRGLNVDGQLSYNIIYNCRYGIEIVNASQINIWNNVLYGGTGSFPKAVYISDTGTYYVDTVDFRNNIVTSGWGYVISVPNAWKNHLNQFDYNAVQSNSIEVVGTAWYTLAQLKSGGDALNSFSTDPLFVTAGSNFHLQAGSPCINTGISVGLVIDHDGSSVADPPEIGAYEYP